MTISFLRIGFLHTGEQLSQVSNWGSREVLVATIVVNMPIISPSKFRPGKCEQFVNTTDTYLHKVVKKSVWQRNYGTPNPHPYQNSTIGEGRCERMRNRRSHLQIDDIPPSNDNEINNSTGRRRDSVAATTIKTESDEPSRVLTGSRQEDVPLTPISHPVRQSFHFDFDLERNAPEESPVNPAIVHFVAADPPSAPEPALFWAR